MGAKDANLRNSREPKQRKSFTRQREQFDVRSIWTDAFREAVDIALSEGGAIRLGLTRDGGALAVGIYGIGNEPSTEYLRPSDDADAFWAELYAAFKGDVGT